MLINIQLIQGCFKENVRDLVERSCRGPNGREDRRFLSNFVILDTPLSKLWSRFWNFFLMFR